MGTTGKVLSCEHCSLVKSFIFSASNMSYDEGKRLASWKFQKKRPYMFLGVFEMMDEYFSNILEYVLKKAGQRV